ncbi:MAG: type II toxin-antitoxin system Phd/YefM family antitoxin [Bradyrhizobium sp.]
MVEILAGSMMRRSQPLGQDGRFDETQSLPIFLTGILWQKAKPMTQHSWPLQDAEGRFNEIVEAAQRMPQIITKNGKPAVVVMDAVEFERLRHLERAQPASFAEALLAMPQDDGKFPRG